jgi:hypothetical protein
MVGTRPDIAYAVGVVARFMHKSDSTHLAAVKRVFQYLKLTKDQGLHYKRVPSRQGTSGDEKVQLEAYLDLDWANCVDDRKSVTGFICLLGGYPISWCSKKQNTTTLSSAEAEYVAASATCQEIMWLRNFLREIGFPQRKATPLYVDNQAAIRLGHNPVLHGRTKHIEVRHHYIREVVANGNVELRYVFTDKNVADIMTKALGKSKFFYHREKLRLEGACWSAGAHQVEKSPTFVEGSSKGGKGE